MGACGAGPVADSAAFAPQACRSSTAPCLLPATCSYSSLHPGYARTMELAEEGTYNWAKAATSIHEILMDPDCPAVFGASLPKPAWLDEPQRFKEVSAKVLETTATIDHPGAQGLAWRMHGDACSRLLEHRRAC